MGAIPIRLMDMLLIDRALRPFISPPTSLQELRRAYPAALVIVLIRHRHVRQQAAICSGADTFISKWKTPERAAERLRSVAASVVLNDPICLDKGLEIQRVLLSRALA